MHMEIERKFLLDPLSVDGRDSLVARAQKVTAITQGYLNSSGDLLRVRACDIQKDRRGDGCEYGVITLKSSVSGLSREEREWEIPPSAAWGILEAVENEISKIRCVVSICGHLWEIDLFDSNHVGLVIAEVELESEDESLIVPGCMGPEITAYRAFYSAHLNTLEYTSHPLYHNRCPISNYVDSLFSTEHTREI